MLHLKEQAKSRCSSEGGHPAARAEVGRERVPLPMHRWPESLFRYPVFEAISLFFPLSLSEGGDEEDLVCLRVEMRKMYFIPTHNVSSHGWG